MSLLVCLSFASCKKGDKDKTESTTSTEGTSSYNFELDDDADEPLTSEEEEIVASKWSSIVNDSDAVVIEPYKPSTSPDSSSSNVSSTETTSSSEDSSSEPKESSDVSTSSEIPYYPGVH